MSPSKTKEHRTPTRGVVYVRVSTDAQVKGTSLDDQERQCRQALDAASISCVRAFRDQGASAKTANREALWAAVDFCLDASNEIGVFMVWKVDRFARRTEDHFAIRKILHDAGIQLRSATEPIGNDPSSKLFEVMVAGFAEFDNAVRSLRSVNGMRARIRDGVWPFRAPIGYRNRSLARQDVKKTDPDPPDPIVFPIMQRVLKGFAAGVYSQSDMVAELLAANVDGLTGTKINLKFIDHLLSRQLPFYAGWLPDTLADEPELHRGRHVPMISEAEWQRIEAIRRGSARFGITHDRLHNEFPLRRFVRCAECERPLTGSSPRGSHARYAYYHCFNKACSRRYKNIPKAELEDAFRSLLAAIRPKPAFYKLLEESLADWNRERAGALSAAGTTRAERASEIALKRTRIFELAEANAYTPDQARERLAALEYQLVGLPEASAEPDPEQIDVAEAKAAIELVLSSWLAFDPPVRAQLQKLVFPEGLSFDRERGFGTMKIARIFELDRASGTCEPLGRTRPPKGVVGTTDSGPACSLQSQFERKKSPEVGLWGAGWNEHLDEVIGELRTFIRLRCETLPAKSPTSPSPRRSYDDWREAA
jgi:site-specific DNA recombinase